MATRITFDNTERWGAYFQGEAIDHALEAAAEPYKEWVQRALREGFTTGEYVTGEAADSVYVTPVHDGPDGKSIGVRTDLDYPLFWEFGFHHAGSGNYYRSPTFGPAIDAAAPEMADAFRAQMLAEASV